MKPILSLALFLFTATFLFAQNLVPNPSFEKMSHLPIKSNHQNNFTFEGKSGSKAYKRNLNYWKSGNKATPDLRVLSPRYLSMCKTKYPNCDEAKTGMYAAGIITFMDKPGTGEYREYLQVQLKHALKKEIKTYVELWVIKTRDAKLISNNIGCYFSTKKIYAPHTGTINIPPQVNHAGMLNVDSIHWEKITWTFEPADAYNFITIGNFFHNDRTESKEVVEYVHFEKYIPSAYYLIDNVRVWQEGDTIEVIPFVLEEIEINTPIQLNNIEFPTNSAVLATASYGELNKLLQFLKDKPTLKIAIHGHTDNVGNNGTNLKLSKARAKAVYDFLLSKGIDKTRLTSEGFGEEKPMDTNETASGREKNRRVEFLVMEK